MVTREIAELAASLRIDAIDLVELHAAAPAFDVIAYAEAARRGCVAVRKGEELFINYNGVPDDASPLWFEAH